MRRLVVALAWALPSYAAAYALIGDDWTWDPDPLSELFYLNVSSFPSATGSTTEIEDALEGAMDEWTSSGDAEFEYRSGGTTSSTSWTDDGVLVAQWRSGSYGGSTLAVAQYWSSSGNLSDCDIRFYSRNSSGGITWSADPSGADSGEYDLERVAIHEFGHCLGLDHSSDSDAVMYASTSDGTGASGRIINDDDIDGIQAIYGADCGDLDGDGYGRADSCGGDCDDTDSSLSPGTAEVCDGVDQDCDGTVDDGFDVDGDGTTTCEGDCDDADADVNPDATESCNGVDDDCDGSYYSGEINDADGDGSIACEDCDDADATVLPDGEELCDAIDNDCDGYVDNEAADEVAFGVSEGSVSRTGYVYGNTYLADESRLLHSFEAYLSPSSTVSATFYVYESDTETGDYTPVTSVTSSISGSAGWYDSGDLGVTLEAGRYYLLAVGATSGTLTWYRESGPTLTADGGLTPVGYQYTSASTLPDPFSTDPLDSALFLQNLTIGGAEDADADGYATVCDDCDDDDATSWPGATEVCDGADNDCDGSLPSEEGDGDGDGTISCADCDDADATVSPTATESCNGVDDDCSGAPGTDEVDADGDGFIACDTDCDDTDADIHPGATEVCDGVDNDCDDVVDTSGATTSTTLTLGNSSSSTSISGDAYGNVITVSEDMALSSFSAYLDPSSTPTATFQVYEATSSTGTYTRVASASTSISGAAGWFDSGTLDVELTGGRYYALLVGVSSSTTFYRDYAPTLTTSSYLTPVGYLYDTSSATPSSTSNNPSSSYLYYHRMVLEIPDAEVIDDDGDGYTEFCDDCDDTDATVSPGATESCDGADEDCDGSAGADEVDADGDGAMVCEGDCDDADAAVSPSATEACNGADDDCDGAFDAGEVDADGDGAMVCEGDCDDADDAASPDATETCNGVDDDCDGAVDASGATEEVDETWGASTTSTSISGDAYGNVYQPSEDMTLSSFSAYLDPSGTVTATFQVYEATTETGTYSRVATASRSISGSSALYASGTLDVEFTAGRYYALIVGVSSTTYFSRDTTPAFTEASYLTPVGSIYDTSSATPSSIGNNPSTSALYYQELDLAIPVATDVDDDGDGWSDFCDDCDDADADVSPDAVEVCDGADNDCDGTADVAATDEPTWYPDADGDGEGGASTSAIACDAPLGYVAGSTDCDDTDATVSTAGVEVCNDVDDDCDGTIDEDAVDAATWYLDGDGDGEGDVYVALAACDAPAGYVAGALDCDDTDATVSTAGVEVCNDADDDCDGTIDEDAVDAATWYLDGDGDGEGDVYAALAACDAPVGYVAGALDCDDTDATVSTAGVEVCNDADDDCDGTIDQGAADAMTWYADSDGDGEGDATASTTACDTPAGYVANALDCDDTDTTVSTDGVETCDGADDDCDGTIDDGAIDAATWYDDADGDGAGGTTTASACEAPAGYVADTTDCDDSDATVHPGAAEAWYDGIDQDCDGNDTDHDGDGWAYDTDCDDLDAATNPAATDVWYDGIDADCAGDDDYDADADGWVSASWGGDDCDDADAATWPGAPDVAYDGVIQDCDASDEYDADGDGYLAEAWGGDDCDDANSGSYPGAVEAWYDGIDQDCDGNDTDQDGDGWAYDTDCDDLDAATYPGATDVWYDGLDADCAGDDDYDADADGWVSASWGGDDCDDADAATWPGAPDVAYDGVIQDCDASDEYDADGDGYLAEAWGGDDCDDASSGSYPGAVEAWYDGIDQDCDGNDTDQDGDGWSHDTDCDDLDAAVYPGSPGLDLDCLAIDTGDSGGDDPADTAAPMDTASEEDTSVPSDTAPPDTDPEDTDAPADTSDRAHVEDTGVPPSKSGCGCSGGAGAVEAMALLAAALLVARRRISRRGRWMDAVKSA